MLNHALENIRLRQYELLMDDGPCCSNQTRKAILDELHALYVYSSMCSWIDFPSLPSNFAAFNDTAVHYIPKNVKKLPKIPDIPPMYKIFAHEIIL
ncbi:unnamed protein product [Gongylonema pulchrum]|uniref:DDE-1 domain-containing protein n=1 Tax=Gongylonema pulchrum TaxID=637853 RepID=A0A183DLJ2_9BILA|nr:unnamed protein product [Gongylonema pulchrum]